MTSNDSPPSSRLPGFYRLPVAERVDKVVEFSGLNVEERFSLRHEALAADQADHMIENVIGVHGLPLGVAANFRVNGRDYLIPMAVEESSVIAAVSHLAKLVREHGSLVTSSTEPIMIGQVQILKVSDPDLAVARLEERKSELLAIANEQDPVLQQLGGGAREIEVRALSTERGPMVVLHLLVDVRDAMGANAVNSMAEATAPHAAEIAGGVANLRIISNLSDRRLAAARLEIAPEAFAADEWDGDTVVEHILDACAFAAADPYRAATHNKGIMNGIDAVAIATANDWRAVEAGAHAYATRNGRYGPLSRWSRGDGGELVGELEMPMALGIAGGATKVHPTAQIALKIMGVKSARELSELAVAVGLVQNLAALRSLVTEGIQKGHMVLHARNIAISAGAVGDMAVRVAGQMIREGRIRFDRAREILRLMVKTAHGKAHDLHMRVEQHTSRGDEKKE